ncbi:heparan-sulfate lyase [Pedobacter steynii]|uniref:Heparan-sulfate lyase n=1 Tax=Pedobacter steynii TaxID=430522 RepID=A0A1G9JPD0_9SPHI|nr:heparin-sulfate lyase HepC [Pedobacter steynii]NQX38316.1 heparinase II/III family protein [Pedobacter steynii]SDL39379.1 heparan-sulfate lyase [Pedobacter steynii]
MKLSVVFLLTLIGLGMNLKAQDAPLTKESFSTVNLSYPGLENVNKAVGDEQYEQAAKLLLDYYRNRSGVKHLSFNLSDNKSFAGKKINEETRGLADNILKHQFKPHKGYPAFNYGQDINWQYRPVKDQLLSTFLHRTAFWEPLGLVYRSTGDERYAKEWVFELRDWVKKNKRGAYPDDKDYAWKAFVVSFRLNHWSGYFNLFLNSPNFTPAFLMEFLQSYNEQSDYVMANYTDIGNHRLYEALHLMYAGANFPELQHAAAWRKSGIEVLNHEIKKQVLPDGVQFELSPSYHIGTIKIFLDALQIAQLAGLSKEFPKNYSDLVEKMILAVGKYSFPDYTFPLYGNSFLTNKTAMLRDYQNWAKVFPDNKVIEYYATDGAKGQAPDGLSTALPNAGFYAFRNGWTEKAIVMQVKAGPPASFHSHPDNGTFDLWVKGRNFTPEPGSFIYANLGGQKNTKRDWYRSTKVHQTLTLDDQTTDINKAFDQKWEASPTLDRLTFSNPSYQNLTHQRSILFVDKTYFLIVDRAIGDAQGRLDIHYVLKEDAQPKTDPGKLQVYTSYTDNNNLLIQLLNPSKASLKTEESFVSYAYQKEAPRPAFAFEKEKNGPEISSFMTILYPFQGKIPPLVTIKENAGNDLNKGLLDITLLINGKSKTLKKNLNQ